MHGCQGSQQSGVVVVWCQAKDCTTQTPWLEFGRVASDSSKVLVLEVQNPTAEPQVRCCEVCTSGLQNCLSNA